MLRPICLIKSVFEPVLRKLYYFNLKPAVTAAQCYNHSNCTVKI